jgi:predicted SAM-dependent methyltransferase
MSKYADRVNNEGKKVLEIGAGYYPKPGATVTLDKTDNGRDDELKLDIIRDFAKHGIPFDEDTFDEVRAYDVVEHIELWSEFVFMMNEVWRVLKKGGIFMFTTPARPVDVYGHITHFRIITPGNMEPYFKNSDSPEYMWMRKTEGIVCDFDMNFKQGADESILIGELKKK